MGKLASIKQTGTAYQATVYERRVGGGARPLIMVNGPLEVVTRWKELSSDRSPPAAPTKGRPVRGRAPAPRRPRLAPTS